jgi:hypothetical protein
MSGFSLGAIAGTIGQTLLDNLPTLLGALAIASPQDAMIASAAIIVSQDITAAIKDHISGNITSTQLIAKIKAAGPAMETTQTAWSAFAASKGLPESASFVASETPAAPTIPTGTITVNAPSIDVTSATGATGTVIDTATTAAATGPTGAPSNPTQATVA